MARWVVVLIALGAALSLGFVIVLLPQQGWSITVLVLSGLAAMFLLGLTDGLVSRIVLGPNAIHVVSLRGRRSYDRAEIASTKIDGGSVFLELRGGGWAKLPDTGRNALGVLNTVRAWLKRGD